MKIDCVNAHLTIKDDLKTLETRHASQIAYWGFKKIGDIEYRALLEDNADLLVKVVKYFEKENVAISLSESSEEILNNKLARSNVLFANRDRGAKFKSGLMTSDECKDFIRFATKQIPRRLKNHQLKSACHLYLVEHGANFSVPGSGKTAVVLTVYEKLRSEKKVNTLIVIGPPACFAPWRDEFFKTLGRNPDCATLAGGVREDRKSMYYPSAEGKKELYFLTFQTLTNDDKELAALLNRDGLTAYVVIDEAHYIKQLGGVWAQSVLGIANSAAYRCILTGTPMPRSLTDSFNLFEFLWPQSDLIGSTLRTRIQLYERDRTQFDNLKNQLMVDINPWFFRVRKSDLGLKEPQFHAPHLIPMNRVERQIYDAIFSRIRTYASQDYLLSYDVVSRLQQGRMIRLRQCVSCAALLTGVVEGYDENIIGESDLSEQILNYSNLEVPAKLTVLGEMVDKLSNENKKVIIWANFVGTLELIKRFMVERGHSDLTPMFGQVVSGVF